MMMKKKKKKKYRSKAERLVIEQVAAECEVDEDHLAILFSSYCNILAEELKNPEYREITCKKLGTFKFKEGKLGRLLKKWTRKREYAVREQKLDRFRNDFYNNIIYYYKKLFNNGGRTN